MSCIYILPVKTDPFPWIEKLEKSIYRTFGYNSRLYNSDVNLESAFDLKRVQYNSSEILLQVISDPPADTAKILCVVEVDLFIPVLTFVFGEAQLRGIGSIVSLHRLNNKFYGLPPDSELLENRLIKEAVHELGHNFGLVHCPNPKCVMRSSTYVEDIDQKSDQMCAACENELGILRAESRQARK